MSSSILYDDSDIQSILLHANNLLNKTIYEILGDEVIEVKDKGLIGKIIEKYWFHIEPNNSPKPQWRLVKP